MIELYPFNPRLKCQPIAFFSPPELTKEGIGEEFTRLLARIGLEKPIGSNGIVDIRTPTFVPDGTAITWHQDCTDLVEPDNDVCTGILSWSNVSPTEFRTASRHRITGIEPFDVVLVDNTCGIEHRYPPRVEGGRWFVRLHLNSAEFTAVRTALAARPVDRSTYYTLR